MLTLTAPIYEASTQSQEAAVRGRPGGRNGARALLWWLVAPLLAIAAGAGDAHASCPDQAATIHLNQVGFAPDSGKFAVLAAPSPVPVEWQLEDGEGALRHRGTTEVTGNDPVAGQHVHQIDFGEFREPGAGYVLVSQCARSYPFDIASGLFEQLPYDALAYFYHNRSGMPIDADYAGSEALARPAAHESEKVTCRSGEDELGNVWPGCDYTLDVTGGWYDAGDHGKYVVNGGIAVWTLLNAWERQRAFERREQFDDGEAAIPEAGNGVNDLLDEARYELEFLLRMQAPRDSLARVPVGVQRNKPDLEFVIIDASGMAHHKVADLNWTALPTPPHLDTEERALYPVSTAATLNLAATAAQCARVWRGIDDDFSARCLRAAERAWAAAVRNPDVYFIAGFTGSGMYGDSELSDEFFWAASELFVTTQSTMYVETVLESPYFAAVPGHEPAWRFVAPLGLITLGLGDNLLSESSIAAVRERLIAAAEQYRREGRTTGYRLPYASERYAWGSNSTLLNRAILLAYAHDFTGDERYRAAVVDVVDYLLGRNPLDQSYISGYGEQSMANPHHRYWVPSADARLSGPPPGTLSGGPNNTMMVDPVARELKGKCAPLTCWRDDVEAYAFNEVAINWNAPLVWVAAYLAEQESARRIASDTAPAGARLGTPGKNEP